MRTQLYLACLLLLPASARAASAVWAEGLKKLNAAANAEPFEKAQVYLRAAQGSSKPTELWLEGKTNNADSADIDPDELQRALDRLIARKPGELTVCILHSHEKAAREPLAAFTSKPEPPAVVEELRRRGLRSFPPSGPDILPDSSVADYLREKLPGARITAHEGVVDALGAWYYGQSGEEGNGDAAMDARTVYMLDVNRRPDPLPDPRTLQPAYEQLLRGYAASGTKLRFLPLPEAISQPCAGP